MSNRMLDFYDHENKIANSLLMDATIFMLARLLPEDDMNYFWECKREKALDYSAFTTNEKDTAEVLEIIGKLATNVETIRNVFKGE